MNKSLNNNITLTFFLLLFLTQTIAIQTIQLPLSAADDGKLTTFFEIGNVEEQMQIDINQSIMKVCCKKQNSIFQKVYYFLFNPFFQIYDYTCKKTDQEGFVTDSAKITKLGFIEISFQQQQFPQCSKGMLGLNNHSYFSSFLPVNLKSFTIFQNPAQYKKYTLKFGEDEDALKEYTYLNVIKQFNWGIQPDNTKFNQVLLGNSPLVLNSNQNIIKLPQKIYEYVVHELIGSFECRQIYGQLYCPCQTGSTDSYPSFIFSFGGTNLEIKPQNYLSQDSSICKIQVVNSQQSYVEANILLFQDFVFKFDPLHKRIGILKNLNDLNSQKIKLPLQLILNCLVILLLCIFLALVLIQIIKRVSGLAQVRDQVFRVDIRDKNEFHYASD